MLALLHLEIEAEYDLSPLRYHDRLMPGFTLDLNDEVMATITPKQEKRFDLAICRTGYIIRLVPGSVFLDSL